MKLDLTWMEVAVPAFLFARRPSVAGVGVEFPKPRILDEMVNYQSYIHVSSLAFLQGDSQVQTDRQTDRQAGRQAVSQSVSQ